MPDVFEEVFPFLWGIIPYDFPQTIFSNVKVAGFP
jgi:hypothetical protein